MTETIVVDLLGSVVEAPAVVPVTALGMAVTDVIIAIAMVVGEDTMVGDVTQVIRITQGMIMMIMIRTFR